jgi:hypothetical protein
MALRSNKRRALLLLGALTVACEVPEEYTRSWESLHRAKFLPGYRDYKGEADGTDDGYVVMSYSLPDGVPPAKAVERTIELVATESPCYKVVEQTAYSLLLRCPGGRPRHGGMLDEEYQFLVRPGSGRVYVLTQNHAPGPDYVRFPKILETYQ